jgi:membrane protease YdiL (CAAX protease family)
VGTVAVGRLRDPARLASWIALVAALTAIAYAERASGGKPENDILYKYSTAVDGVFGYAVILGLTLLIAYNHWDLLALRAPRRWGRAIGLLLLVLVVVLVVGGWLDSFLHAGKEQGLTPPGWDSSHAGQYAANFVVIAVVAPFCEELLFRGVGYSLLEAYLTPWPAITFVGLAFGLVHGLVAGLPILAGFGMALAWLRWKTDSVVPGMITHGIFNAIALIAAVAT